MYDIHCHALYGVDDGARDPDTSIAMLLHMYDEGIRTVIMTPHYHGGHMQPDMDTIRNRFEKLRSYAAEDEELREMDLYLGSEIYYYPSIVDWIEEGRVVTMAGSRYVLIEFGFTTDRRIFIEGINSIVSAGYLPIIAHVERYTDLCGDIKSIEELIERGAYIQVNSEALYERRRVRSFVKKLLKNELVHFLATDAHDMSGRAPFMAREVRYISGHYGEEYCRRIVIDNPAKIISNEYI